MPVPEPSARPEPEPLTPRVSTEAVAAGWWYEIQALDMAVYAAISASSTPTLDRGFAALSRAADQAKLWMGAAGLLAATGGARGRRSAVSGLVAIAVASAVANLVKPLRSRRRPDRIAHRVPNARHVAMPRSTSFPSAHAASAFAFASGVAHELPVTGIPLQAAATLVAYSRVHTGVHYPIDVIAGAVLGSALAPLTTAALPRRGADDCPQ